MFSADLAAALCLVAVIEGLLLFAAPDAWKRMAAEIQKMESKRLRFVGGAMILLGLLALQWVR